jgi:hypothetical protein
MESVAIAQDQISTAIQGTDGKQELAVGKKQNEAAVAIRGDAGEEMACVGTKERDGKDEQM